MHVMAEVTRSFDLKSWQGLTEVLKVARESNLAPHAYSEFRNLVLEYAQQKGSDPELKKRIDAIINTFGEQKQIPPATPLNTIAPQQKEHAPIQAAAPLPRQDERSGRRGIPTFTQQMIAPVVDQASQTTAPIATSEPLPVAVAEVPEAVTPNIEVKETPSPEVSLKSIEEHRVRIMDMKRRVNALVGNPITLMDHGNNIGREYMSALLNALKATSPGSTANAGEAMSTLEAAFVKILEHAAAPAEEPAPKVATADEKPAKESEPAIEPPTAEPQPKIEEVQVQAEPQEEAALPVEIPVEKPDVVAPVASQSTPEQKDKRWNEAGGDVDLASQIKTLRSELKAREIEIPNRPERPRRSLIPSIIEMEEEPIPAPVPEEREPHKQAADELSTSTLTNRANSTMTGITLGTPQAELVSPEISSALSDFLHEWSIFASSGIFGMGPAGIEHPLYIRLSRLPMGEVLSGRFDDADMKTVHLIKGYVDAWRHEQGIAYNPTETFEHYLRRVTQRIMKRQKGA